jgi:hypothetical protein
MVGRFFLAHIALVGLPVLAQAAAPEVKVVPWAFQSRHPA